VASTEAYGNPVSVRFPLFQHQHSTNMDCFWVTRCLCNLDLLPVPSRDNTCIPRKIAQNVQKSFAAVVPPQTPPGELTTLTQTSSRWAWGRLNSQHSLDCHLMFSVPPLKKKIFWIAIRHDASAINSNARSLILQKKLKGYFVENCNKHNNK